MTDLVDMDHLFGEDVSVTPSGDIAVVSNHSRTIQRVIRRLLTAQTSQAGTAYPWQPEYGAGLPQMIGQENIDPGRVQAIVLSQLLIEPTVSRTPLPTIAATSTGANGIISINVNYTDLSGSPQSFGFDLA